MLLDEDRINTSGGVIHYLGIGWAGDCERPVSALPAHDREIAFPSGAAMVVRREIWLALGGLDRDYFMYGEDLDLGLRLWLAGHRVGIVPGARVTHGYEFDKGPYKWFWLERNRWRTVLSVYPAPLLALLGADPARGRAGPARRGRSPGLADAEAARPGGRYRRPAAHPRPPTRRAAHAARRHRGARIAPHFLAG